MIGKMFYFKFFPAIVLSEICEMSAEERGRYLSKMCGDLVRGSSDDGFIQGMIDEANNYSNIKRLAGSKGGKAKASNAIALLDSAIAEPSTPLASNSSISSTVTKEEPKPKTSGVRFTPPTIEEVTDYCLERKNGIDPETFVAHYTANGWVQSSGRKIKDWKSTVITWEKREKKKTEDKTYHKFLN